jgi:hypothetical protein
MKKVYVSAAGRISDGSPSMGTLVDEGILTKEYVSTGIIDAHQIVWTNVSENVIVENGHETIMPGNSIVWEK